MLKSHSIEVILQKGGFIIPDEIAEPFVNAGHKRVLLKATYEKNKVETHIALRKRNGVYFAMFGKGHHKTLGIFPSDIFQVQLWEDTTKYGVEMPESFQAVLDSDPEGADIFESLTDGKKRGLIYFIKRIKSEQTQVDKSILILENLKRGLRDARDLTKKL